MLQQLGAFFKRLFGSQPPVEDTGWAFEERRAWLRRPCDLTTTFRPVDDPESEPEQGHICNISRGGMCMVTRRQFEPGSQIAVDLPAESADGTKSTVLARVIRIAPTEKNEWELGCTFVAELSDQELQPFGAAKVRSLEPGGRVWTRFPCHALATYSIIRIPELGKQPATIVDLSASGIGMTVFRPVEVGALLNLELKGKDEWHNVSILACVLRSSRVAAAKWNLGCSFISELDQEQFEGLLA